MRQQIDDGVSGVLVHAHEHVFEVVDRVDVVLLAAGDERVEDGEIVASVFVADEEEVLAAERDAAQAGLGDVVVGRDSRVTKEATELAPVAE